MPQNTIQQNLMTSDDFNEDLKAFIFKGLKSLVDNFVDEYVNQVRSQHIKQDSQVKAVNPEDLDNADVLYKEKGLATPKELKTKEFEAKAEDKTNIVALRDENSVALEETGVNKFESTAEDLNVVPTQNISESIIIRAFCRVDMVASFYKPFTVVDFGEEDSRNICKPVSDRLHKNFDDCSRDKRYAEKEAILRALELCQNEPNISIRVREKFIYHALTGRLKKWAARGWTRNDGAGLEDKDLLVKIYNCLALRELSCLRTSFERTELII